MDSIEDSLIKLVSKNYTQSSWFSSDTLIYLLSLKENYNGTYPKDIDFFAVTDAYLNSKLYIDDYRTLISISIENLRQTIILISQIDRFITAKGYKSIDSLILLKNIIDFLEQKDFKLDETIKSHITVFIESTKRYRLDYLNTFKNIYLLTIYYKSIDKLLSHLKILSIFIEKKLLTFTSNELIEFIGLHLLSKAFSIQPREVIGINDQAYFINSIDLLLALDSKKIDLIKKNYLITDKILNIKTLPNIDLNIINSLNKLPIPLLNSLFNLCSIIDSYIKLKTEATIYVNNQYTDYNFDTVFIIPEFDNLILTLFETPQINSKIDSSFELLIQIIESLEVIKAQTLDIKIKELINEIIISIWHLYQNYGINIMNTNYKKSYFELLLKFFHTIPIVNKVYLGNFKELWGKSLEDINKDITSYNEKSKKFFKYILNNQNVLIDIVNKRIHNFINISNSTKNLAYLGKDHLNILENIVKLTSKLTNKNISYIITSSDPLKIRTELISVGNLLINRYPKLFNSNEVLDTNKDISDIFQLFLRIGLYIDFDSENKLSVDFNLQILTKYILGYSSFEVDEQIFKLQLI